MHIVFVCNELPPASAGGIGPCVATLAQGLAKQGAKVTVVGTYDHDYNWAVEPVKMVPILHWRPNSRGIRRWRHHIISRRLAIYKALKKIHAANAIDIIEWPDYQGLSYREIPGVTEVTRIHSTRISLRIQNLAPVDKIWENCERRHLARVTNWIGVSDWFLKKTCDITGFSPSYSTIIYNPVDTSLFFPGKPATDFHKIKHPLVLYSGSITRGKGIFQSAKAAKKFLKNHATAEFWIIGRAWDQTDLNLLESHFPATIRHRVKIMYPISQQLLSEIMRCADVFLMPSYAESFGNVWAEAMACGVPVVGSTLSCGPEIIPAEAGICVDPENIEAIAQAVQSLLDNPQKAKAMGTQGRRIALEIYAVDKAVDQSLHFYQTCIDNH